MSRSCSSLSYSALAPNRADLGRRSFRRRHNRSIESDRDYYPACPETQVVRLAVRRCLSNIARSIARIRAKSHLSDAGHSRGWPILLISPSTEAPPPAKRVLHGG